MIMNNYGIFQIRPYYAKLNGKVWKIFENLKRKANQPDRVRVDPRLAEHDDDLASQQRQREAMKSIHLQDEVLRTDEGFVV